MERSLVRYVNRMDGSMPDMANLDDELVAAITPDVLKCLRRSEFFEKLDSQLCPEKKKARPRKCKGDHNLSRKILRACGFDSRERTEIVAVLKSRGGCCDCEVLYNVAKASRLKAKYWSAQLSSRAAATRGRRRPRHTG